MEYQINTDTGFNLKTRSNWSVGVWHDHTCRTPDTSSTWGVGATEDKPLNALQISCKSILPFNGIVLLNLNSRASDYQLKLVLFWGIIMHLLHHLILKFILTLSLIFICRTSSIWSSSFSQTTETANYCSWSWRIWCSLYVGKVKTTWKPSTLQYLVLKLSFCKSQNYACNFQELSGTNIYICWFPMVSPRPFWVRDESL